MIETAQRIQDKIEQLIKLRGGINEKAQVKAMSLCEYRKQEAIAMLKVAKSQIKKFEGESVPAKLTSPEKKVLVEGLCRDTEAQMLIAESNYKSHIVNMQALEAELNGWQSINRYLQHEVQQ